MGVIVARKAHVLRVDNIQQAPATHRNSANEGARLPGHGLQIAEGLAEHPVILVAESFRITAQVWF